VARICIQTARESYSLADAVIIDTNKSTISNQEAYIGEDHAFSCFLKPPVYDFQGCYLIRLTYNHRSSSSSSSQEALSVLVNKHLNISSPRARYLKGSVSSHVARCLSLFAASSACGQFVDQAHVRQRLDKAACMQMGSRTYWYLPMQYFLQVDNGELGNNFLASFTAETLPFRRFQASGEDVTGHLSASIFAFSPSPLPCEGDVDLLGCLRGVYILCILSLRGAFSVHSFASVLVFLLC
jgi:hypothetical protein